MKVYVIALKKCKSIVPFLAPKKDCNFDTKLQSFFYPLRSNGISSRNLFACISSKRARKSLFFAYHHALACIETP